MPARRSSQVPVAPRPRPAPAAIPAPRNRFQKAHYPTPRDAMQPGTVAAQLSGELAYPLPRWPLPPTSPAWDTPSPLKLVGTGRGRRRGQRRLTRRALRLIPTQRSSRLLATLWTHCNRFRRIAPSRCRSRSARPPRHTSVPRRSCAAQSRRGLRQRPTGCDRRWPDDVLSRSDARAADRRRGAPSVAAHGVSTERRTFPARRSSSASLTCSRGRRADVRCSVEITPAR